MRGVVQRVSYGKVTLKADDLGSTSLEPTIAGEIGNGYVVLLGVGEDDTLEDGIFLAEKIANLRVFPDESGKLNLSIRDVGGEILVVSQFTLFGDCRKGRRPSFSTSAKPELAKELYLHFVDQLKTFGIKVETGIFQADMAVEIHNDGPVTLLLDSKKLF